MPRTGTLVFHVNGQPCQEVCTDPTITLLEYLRSTMRLTGAKLGCGEGGCGACTVLVSRREKGAVRHRAINACLAPLCSIDGCAVTTVEGIGSSASPHAIQTRLAQLHGSQCGFCTPGIVMALYASLLANPSPRVIDIEDALDGNLCRCTGYRPILDTAKTFAVDAMPEACRSCLNLNECTQQPSVGAVQLVESTTRSKAIACQKDSKLAPVVSDAVLPPPEVALDELLIRGSRGTWYRPQSLAQLLEFTTSNPTSRIVAGNTEIGVEALIKKSATSVVPCLVDVSAVPELHTCFVDANTATVSIGAAAPLSEVREFLSALPSGRTVGSAAYAVSNILRWFGSSIIRNAATFGGNLCTASPISDLAPILTALDAELRVAQPSGTERCIPISKWITGYRRVNMAPGEVLVSVVFGSRKEEALFVKAFKQARRRDDDIAIVSCAFAAEYHPDTRRAVVRGALGGVAPTTHRYEALDAILGELIAADTFDESLCNSVVADCVASQLSIGPLTPGGMPAYRRVLVASMAARYVRLARRHFFARQTPPSVDDDDKEDDDRDFIDADRPVSHGLQRYVTHAPSVLNHARPVPFSTQSNDACPGTVGEPVPHTSALLHTTGEAVYVDDIAVPSGTMHAIIVWSTRPSGAFTIDASALRHMAGVLYVDATDLSPEQNAQGLEVKDEELFRRSHVTAVGQPLALIAADSLKAALDAAQAVRVTYVDGDDTRCVPVTIADAERDGSILPGGHIGLEDGGPPEECPAADVVTVEGEMRIAGQEHFYLETTAALAIPHEADELEVYCSTQWCSGVQQAVCQTTGMPHHKVIIRAKRLGGAFGGKETRAAWLAVAVAVAARKARRPVRLSLLRSEDMVTQGARHPFLARYRMSAARDGRILSFDVDLHSNTGHAADLGVAVMQRALYNIAGSFKIPRLAARGHVWRTNTGNNTGFRGFGAPQANLIVENAVEHLASELRLDPFDVRRMNFIQQGERTHYGQVVEGQTLNRLWELAASPAHADYAARRRAIDAFNGEHRYKKRGIAMTAVLYGVGLPGPLHQATAVVAVYLDGTVAVHHGGVEMGQGLNIKVLQVAAASLGVSLSKVFTLEANTAIVPNASPSAASVSFDLYGMAVLDACEVLNARLAPFRPRDADSPDEAFRRTAVAAHGAKVSLTATGFTDGRVPNSDGSPGVDIGFEFGAGPVSRGQSSASRGTPMQYWTQGVGCSEVELDTVTGDYRVTRVDIVMDIGASANPGIDVGQIEGAFVQGLGMYSLEETVWGSRVEHPWLPAAHCYTKGPGTYKIPTVNDVPIDFRVSLMGGAPNPRGIHGSKAVGEPPLLLAASAFMAAKDAIVAARRANGVTDEGPRYFAVDSPLTAERARLSCDDPIARRFVTDNVAAGGLPRAAIFC